MAGKFVMGHTGSKEPWVLPSICPARPPAKDSVGKPKAPPTVVHPDYAGTKMWNLSKIYLPPPVRRRPARRKVSRVCRPDEGFANEKHSSEALASDLPVTARSGGKTGVHPLSFDRGREPDTSESCSDLSGLVSGTVAGMVVPEGKTEEAAADEADIGFRQLCCNVGRLNEQINRLLKKPECARFPEAVPAAAAIEIESGVISSHDSAAASATAEGIIMHKGAESLKREANIKRLFKRNRKVFSIVAYSPARVYGVRPPACKAKFQPPAGPARRTATSPKRKRDPHLRPNAAMKQHHDANFRNISSTPRPIHKERLSPHLGDAAHRSGSVPAFPPVRTVSFPLCNCL